jgi:hypothetical protein
MAKRKTREEVEQEEQPEEIYEVERILAHRGKGVSLFRATLATAFSLVCVQDFIQFKVK